MKNRSGPHETTLRELKIGPKGLTVGEPLLQFHGVLTGTPEFSDEMGRLFESEGDKR
jgi:circadian clock protein KaiC